MCILIYRREANPFALFFQLTQAHGWDDTTAVRQRGATGLAFWGGLPFGLEGPVFLTSRPSRDQRTNLPPRPREITILSMILHSFAMDVRLHVLPNKHARIQTCYTFPSKRAACAVAGSVI